MLRHAVVMTSVSNYTGGKEIQEKLKATPKIDVEQLFFEHCQYTDILGVESSKNPSLPRRTCLTVREFSKEETEALRLACRKNKTTIQGAAQIAASVAAGIVPLLYTIEKTILRNIPFLHLLK